MSEEERLRSGGHYIDGLRESVVKLVNQAYEFAAEAGYCIDCFHYERFKLPLVFLRMDCSLVLKSRRCLRCNPIVFVNVHIL